MPNFSDVSRDHVLLALAEHDSIGRDAFLETYGFGPATAYVLLHEGREYDSTAILGVALKYASGEAAKADEFSGGKDGAAGVLRDLGFEVTGDEWREATEVGVEASRAEWAIAARDLLIDTAKTYGAVTTTKELAAAVQQTTGLRTTQAANHWIGDVLSRVAADCVSREEPVLSSLAVLADGGVGPKYADAIATHTGERPTDGEMHAARSRLECHRFHEATGLPDDGGSANLTPRLSASRTRARKAAAAEKPVATCPRCFMALAMTGECDNCDE